MAFTSLTFVLSVALLRIILMVFNSGRCYTFFLFGFFWNTNLFSSGSFPWSLGS